MIMTNPAGQTSFGPMSVVAMEQYEPESQRLVQDELALRFLPAALQPIIKLTRWAPLRAWMLNLSEKSAPGVWGGVLYRKRYIDERLLEALSMGIETVVNLGAGLDTRCYRLPALSKVAVFEVDLPQNIERKKARIEQLYGSIPAHITLVPIDFDSQELAKVLASQGYRDEHKSFFIWEAVTQYLTEEGIQKTFSCLAQARPGSRLVFTYVCKDFIDGTSLYGLDRLYQTYRVKRQLWHFGLDPEQVSSFLKGYAWKELEQMGSQEYRERYLEPLGRTLTVMPIERAVYAEKN
jgi:methyltransferase (TIGR00027 family)